LNLKVVLEVQQENDDQYLTKTDKFELARKSISYLLSRLQQEMNLDNWDIHLIVQGQTTRWMRIAMGDEDVLGTDLAKAKREAARGALVGSNVKP
jgi:hypothetical protein